MKWILQSVIALVVFSPPVATAQVNVTSFPSIAALQALGSAASTYSDAQTESYYAGLGKGGAQYRWDPASTANDCTHIAVTGVATGRYILRTDLQNNYILPTQCGAYFDTDTTGTTGHDDAAAWQAAYDAAYTYGFIVGPVAGNTRLDSSINVHFGTMLQGAGKGNEFVFCYTNRSGNPCFLSQAPVGSASYRGPQFRDFSIYGNLGEVLIQINCASNSAPCGFTDDGTTQGYVDGATVERIELVGYAATIVQFNKCFHCVMRNININSSLGGGVTQGHCLAAFGSDFLLIEQNQLIGCSNGGNAHAIHVEYRGSFGNFDKIVHNDVLRTRATSDAYIYSSAKSAEISFNGIEDLSGDPSVTCNIKIDTGFQVSVHDNIPQAAANSGDIYPICVNGDFWYSLDIYNNAIATGVQWGANFNGNGTVAYYVPSAVPAMRTHVTHHNNTTEAGFPMNTQSSGAIPTGNVIYDSTPDTFLGPTANNYGASVRVTANGLNGTQQPAWLLPANATQANSLITFTNPNLAYMNGTLSLCFKGIVGAAGQQVSVEMDDNGASVATASVTLSGGGGGMLYCPASLQHVHINTNAQFDFWNQDTTHGGNFYLSEVIVTSG